VRALLVLTALSAFAAPAPALSLEVFGYAGLLGEWELTATVTESAARQTREFSGPVTMTHVGLCTQDGPETKSGEMSLQILGSPSRLNATISVAGVACSYSGKLADFYSGMMVCPDRESVPLKLWVK
jgi:hypothetical protein